MPEQPKGFSPSPFSKQQTPLFKMPVDNQFCFQPPEGVVMPFNLHPAQPAPHIFMDQSTFSQNLRTPQSDSSTDFAPQDNNDGSPMAPIKIPYANDLS